MWRSMVLVLALSLGGAPVFAETLHDVGVRVLQQKAALDAASADKVQAVVDRYKPKLDPLRHEDLQIMRRLRGATDDREAKKLTDKLLKNRQRLQSLKVDRLHDIGKLLTPTQLARLITSMPTIDRAVHREARKLHG